MKEARNLRTETALRVFRFFLRLEVYLLKAVGTGNREGAHLAFSGIHLKLIEELI